MSERFPRDEDEYLSGRPALERNDPFPRLVRSHEKPDLRDEFEATQTLGMSENQAVVHTRLNRRGEYVDADLQVAWGLFLAAKNLRETGEP